MNWRSWREKAVKKRPDTELGLLLYDHAERKRKISFLLCIIGERSMKKVIHCIALACGNHARDCTQKEVADSSVKHQFEFLIGRTSTNVGAIGAMAALLLYSVQFLVETERSNLTLDRISQRSTDYHCSFYAVHLITNLDPRPGTDKQLPNSYMRTIAANVLPLILRLMVVRILQYCLLIWLSCGHLPFQSRSGRLYMRL